MPQHKPVDGIGRRRPRNATLALAWRLLASIIAFPIVALGIITLTVIGGTTEITAHDARDTSLISGVVALALLAGLASDWWRATAPEQRRWPHLLMSAMAATVVIGGAAVFATAPAPRNLRRPSLSGLPRVGSSLALRPGVWSLPVASLTFDYQWQRCGRICHDIGGATGPMYRVRPADLGKRLRVSVIATPQAGGWRDFSSNTVYSRETVPTTP